MSIKMLRVADGAECSADLDQVEILKKSGLYVETKEQLEIAQYKLEQEKMKKAKEEAELRETVIAEKQAQLAKEAEAAALEKTIAEEAAKKNQKK